IMKRLLMILLLLACPAAATVEDVGSSPVASAVGMYTSAPAVSYPAPPGYLIVTATIAGPRQEQEYYTTPGKTMDFTISVRNDGATDANADLSVDPGTCGSGWFSWMTQSVIIPAGSARSAVLSVTPDMDALPGDYGFGITASAKNCQAGTAVGRFKIQDFDYASETSVSGTGQFKIDKDVRSMNSGIKSNKNVQVSGIVDTLVKNEYMVEAAKGQNSNFEQQDKVDSYMALSPGDALSGTESFKSSAVFGGVGAKIQQSYNLKEMEFQNQGFNLHQTGSMGKRAEFKTVDNFTGYFLIDAKQVFPGQKSIKEREEFIGSYEIARRLLFKDRSPTVSNPCAEGSCESYTPVFKSPCMSGTCESFVDRLNAFTGAA
ncbi:MAG TPA: hypothetical protein VN455_03360, partial [Methanotrichaceae archaeon]|nr:hypothetical protein [Methanotrichaceae archaeon]